jgi:Dyp-type peroxidase family
MAVILDRADIQGNILRPYGKLGFPKARFILLRVDRVDPDSQARARGFVMELLPLVTTALRWKGDTYGEPGAVERPMVAVNIAFTFYGLITLGVPTRTLKGMPDEFVDGMAKRARILGDDFVGADWRKKWDFVWRPSPDFASVYLDPKTPHILISLNVFAGAPDGELERYTQRIVKLAEAGGLSVLEGHNHGDKPEAPYQDASALFERDPETGQEKPLRKEHFGFKDGISDPAFEGKDAGSEEALEARGNGAFDGEGKWRPLATGEFLLGYPDEAQETPGAAMPLSFSRNGTFMVYRKLHQNVRAWNDYIGEQAERFGKIFGIADPWVARETLVAKMAGRWTDGVPTTLASTFEEWKAFNDKYPDVEGRIDPVGAVARRRALIEFTYRDDKDGSRCPITSHVRRTNTRDDLDPWVAVGQVENAQGSVLNNRRRILRRGLPYGSSGPGSSDSHEHGIIMLIVCASLGRQFEFVQQQWVNYGQDARFGNDTCPIVGNHSLGKDTPDKEARERNGPKAKFVVPAPKGAGHPPFIMEGIPQFVEMRGGEYFFVPSLTALRMIGMGTVDPT